MGESWVPLIWQEMNEAQKALDKCPFCGCPTIWVFHEGDNERFKAVCTDCSAQMYRGTLPELVKAWNRRATDGN